jgi:hypothetical protein
MSKKLRARDRRVPPRRTIRATEAAKNFGRLVSMVREEGATYVVERGGVPVARVGPAVNRRCSLGELVDLLRSLPPAGADFGKAVRAGRSALNKPAVPRDPWAS